MALWVAPATSAHDEDPHPGLTPESVDVVVFPGGSVDIVKTVHTPELPPVLDVCLIVDLSGSYNNDLPNIKALAPDIWDDIVAGGVADLQMGLASFVDFPISPWGSAASGDYAYQLDQQLTATKATWVTAVNAMSTKNGGDGPESQYEALFQVATGVGNDVPPAGPSAGDVAPGQECDFREDATKVAILTTDNLFHVPTDTGGTYPGPSAATTTNALTSNEIVVIGLKAPGAGGELDALALATGGTTKLTSSTSSDIADAILEALKEIEIDVSMTSDCVDPITTTFAPTSQTVESGEDAEFTETIAVSGGEGTYTCRDWALIDGQPMTDESGAIIYETKTIDVPVHFVTGGGQIGKGSRGDNLGGNVGWLLDGTIVGQWQFRDGSEKRNMHSLTIDTLSFADDGGPDADPPAADYNVATFSGTARVKDGAKARWDDTCTFAAEVHDHSEPNVADMFGITITCGADVWDYPVTSLDTGNLQIHQGLKD